MSRHNSHRRRQRHGPQQRGFTLIELLVATTVTLLIIASLSQAFAIVSRTISANRATLEMSGQLRGVTVRLQTDLEEVTAPLYPWLDSSSGMGYFEYIEGPGNDWDSNNDAQLFPRFLTYEDYPSRTNLGNPIRLIDATEPPVGNPPVSQAPFGDVDDIVMFTVRRRSEPFVGQVLGQFADTLPNPPAADPYGRRVLVYDPASPTFTTIQSDTAEIVWWTQGGFLYRRVLLVRPDIWIADPDLSERGGDMPDAFFFSANDLSVRLEPQTGPNRYVRVSNSLGDLTLRQNRHAHDRDLTKPLEGFPYPVLPNLLNGVVYYPQLTPKVNVYLRGSDNAWGNSGDDDGDGATDELDEAGWLGSDDVLIRYAVGEDVMLSNVLAFDVRALDPLAQVRLYSTIQGTQRMVPGDPGFFSPNRPNDTAPASLGAYVDLGYLIHDDYQNIADSNNSGLLRFSHFSRLPHFGSNLPNVRRLPFPTYDTWPLDYERDGVNQDGDVMTDEGTDGLDSDSANGVDDLGERETLAPYNSPLRGLQIRIRLLDPGSRQVRQMTVATDFTPE